MKTFFLLVLFYAMPLFSLDVSLSKSPVYKEIQTAYYFKDIHEAIENKEHFQTIKHYVRLLNSQSHEGLWIKIPLINNNNHSLKRVFMTKWERVELELFLVKEGKVIFSQYLFNEEYLKQSEPFTVPFQKNIDFYIHVKSKQFLSQFFYMYFVEDTLAAKFIIATEKLYHHGLFFGILLTMTLYSFFMYFSIAERGYLFLGFYQLSVLIATSDLRQYFLLLLEKMPLFADFLLRGVLGYLMMFLSILFTKEFLNTKQEMPRFNLFLNILMIFLLSISAIESNMDYTAFLYLIYVFSGIYVFLHKKNVMALLYTLGFLGFPLYLIFSNLAILFNIEFYFEYHYAKQIFTCIESFALTMALYFKIRTIVHEKTVAKEKALKSEALLLEQSRFASMGEMLASIAHQWRQPLSHLNMIMANLQLAFEHNQLDKNYMQKKTEEVDKQLKYMSSTVEGFSGFFATKNKKETFHLEEVIEYTLSLLESRLKKENISVKINVKEDTVYKNYKNELIQVLTIILNNAIDALVSNKTLEPNIEVFIVKGCIVIEDNAGGIKESIVSKIFNPYFTTKHKAQGTGLGLYMAKTIVNNWIKGRLEVKNTQKGAAFSVILS
jgi:signal transduction histidine kinase